MAVVEDVAPGSAARFLFDVTVEKDVGMACQRRLGAATDRDQRRASRLMIGTMVISSSLSPEYDNAMNTSSRVIMPKSPCAASAACTNSAGVPVDASVAAILRPMCPLLPCRDDNAAAARQQQFDRTQKAAIDAGRERRHGLRFDRDNLARQLQRRIAGLEHAAIRRGISKCSSRERDAATSGSDEG